MSDLREAIRTIIYESDTDKLPDAVLAAITAHLTVTEEDARLLLASFYCTSEDYIPPSYAVNAMKVALESYAARKLKAETT